MPTRAVAWITPLALLLAPCPALAAPAGDAAPPELVLTEAELGPVYQVANILSNRPPCAAGTFDLAAASAFVRAASLFDVASRHYPPRPSPRSDPGMHARKRLALVDAAVQLYEQAYQCAPGYPQRHHLESAIDILDAARQLTVATDQLPPDAPELEKLTARRNELIARLPAPPPPPLPPDLPPDEPKDVPTPEPAPVSGHFVLRPEVGFGTGTIMPNLSGYDPSHFSGIYAQILVATRFPLGARKLHAFSMGGVFGLQQVAPKPKFEGEKPTARSIVQGGLHLEFVLHAHPRWFSFHPMLDLGTQAYVGREKFGRGYLAPGLGLCLDREVVCFSFRGSIPLASPGREQAKIFMGQFGLAVDLMRIVERRRGK